jgi:hypothetical protein
MDLFLFSLDTIGLDSEQTIVGSTSSIAYDTMFKFLVVSNYFVLEIRENPILKIGRIR